MVWNIDNKETEMSTLSTLRNDLVCAEKRLKDATDDLKAAEKTVAELRKQIDEQTYDDPNDVSKWSDEKILLAHKLGVHVGVSDQSMRDAKEMCAPQLLQPKREGRLRAGLHTWRFMYQCTLPNHVRMHNGGFCPVDDNALVLIYWGGNRGWRSKTCKAHEFWWETGNSQDRGSILAFIEIV